MLSSSAQSPIFNSRHTINKFSLSPAFAGINSNAESFLTYGSLLTGISGKPEYKLADANFTLGKMMSGGISTSVLNTGNYANYKVTATVAAHFKLAEKSHIAFALSPNFYRNQLEISKVKSQGTDPLLLNANSFVANRAGAGFSALYIYNNLTTGVVVPEITNQGLFYSEPLLLGHLAYFYNINKKFSVEPFAIIQSGPRFIDNLDWSVGTSAKYQKRVWAGFSVSSHQNYGITSGCSLTDNIIMNYEYRTGSSLLARSSGGSHEISIGFLVRRGLKQDFLTAFPQAYANELLEINKEETKQLREDFRKMRKTINRNLNNHEERIKKLEYNFKKLKENQESLSNNTGQNEVPAELWEDPVILQNIKFGSNSDKLFSSSFAELNKVVNFLVRNPMLKVKITGYTDNVGSSRYNKHLSGERAQAVKDYLVRRGINPDRVFSSGKGSDKPIGSNETQEGRAQNRRIEAEYQKK